MDCSLDPLLAARPRLDGIEELAAAGQTVFRFDGTRFIYNWQTLKSYTGCRLLQVKLSDGTSHYAKFTFK